MSPSVAAVRSGRRRDRRRHAAPGPRRAAPARRRPAAACSCRSRSARARTRSRRRRRSGRRRRPRGAVRRAVRGCDARVGDGNALELEHQNVPTSPTRKRSMPRTDDRGQGHQDRARGHGGAEVLGAGLAEQAEDHDRERRVVGPGDERRRAELAQRDRERERRRDCRRARATIGRSTSRQTRAGLAPRASRPPPAAAGRWSAAPDATMRTTNGIATSACAMGTSSGDVRRSSGGVSRVMRNPKPSVTALTPEGHAQQPVEETPARPGGRERGEPADGHRDRGRDQGVDERVADRVGRRDEQDAPRTHAAEGAVVVEARAARRVERARHEHGDGGTHERAHHEQVHDDDGPLAPRPRSAGHLGGRPQPERGGPATLGPAGERQRARPRRRAGRSTARPRAGGSGSASSGGRSRSRACRAPGRRG